MQRQFTSRMGSEFFSSFQSFKTLVAILILTLPTLGDAQQIPSEIQQSVAALIERADNSSLAYDIVESLTTEIGPRLAGTEAEARARDWAVAKFETLGFQNVRIEPFDVPFWGRVVEEAEIVSPYPQRLLVTALGGSPSTPVEGIEGEVIRFSSLAELSDQANNSLDGKIVFVDEVMTRTQDGSGYSVAVAKRRETAYEAARTGALAALIRSVGTSTHRFAHTGQMRSGDLAEAAKTPTAALSAPDADQLARAIALGEPVSIRLRLLTETHVGAPSGNVVADIPGRENPDEIVLIGAHLDSWDLGTGTVDDGAGVGIVMAAARLIAETLPAHPKRTIRVVLFGSEEVGLVGAKAYAERHQDELANHVIATESDFGADRIWRFDSRVGENSLTKIDEISSVLRELGIGPGNNEAYGGPDMKYLREAGVPVVGLVQNGWDYFDLHHTANDTLDKIAPDQLRQNVAAYAIFAYMAAELGANFRD